MHRHRFRRTAAVGLALALALTACGDDADDTADAGAEAPAEAPEEESEPMAEVEGEAIVVTAVDYGYQDLPGTIAAGTTLQLQNDSEAEVHELLAFRVKDDEERSVADLVQLPPEELMAAVEMRGVALAPPGASSTALPTPPLTLEQPGTYAFICILPTDGPPDEVMAAVSAFMERGAPEGEAPDYPDTGPPHFTQGMWAEVTVTA